MRTSARARAVDTPQRQVTQCTGERMPASCHASVDRTRARSPTNAAVVAWRTPHSEAASASSSSPS